MHSDICIATANRDPLVKILGPAYATVDAQDSTILRMVEKVS